MEEKRQMEYEEIDLMDYVKVIIKRKKLIAGVLVVAVVTAGVISLVMPKVHKIDTAIEIGVVSNESGNIEDPAQVLEKIKGDVYGITVREKLNISEEKFPKINAENKKDTNLITLQIDSDKTDQAKSVLDEINNLIIGKHEEKVKDSKDLLSKQIELKKKDIETANNDIERVKAKIGFLEEERNNLEAKVTALQKVLVYRQDAGSQFALFDTKEKLESKKQEIENRHMEVNSLENRINAIGGEINSLEKQIKDIRLTKVVKIPTVSEKQVSPRPVLNVGIAGVLGLFIGVFVAFGKEWWEKNGKKMTNDK